MCWKNRAPTEFRSKMNRLWIVVVVVVILVVEV